MTDIKRLKPFDNDLLKFIFIDFDGTLVDSVPLLYDHYYKFLEKFGREGSLEEFEFLMGPSIEEFIPILKERHAITEPPQKLISVYTEGLAERYKKEAKLIEGSQQFLDYAVSLGLKLTLVTSSTYPLIEGCLENLQLKKYFEYIISGDKVKKTKPDPEIYLLALKTCKAKPEESLSIEDSYNGILASLQAHIPTIAIQYDRPLKIPEAAISVKNWNELHKLFNNWIGV